MKNEKKVLEYRKAEIADAELLIDIYNSSFNSDYVKYGECPAYGKTKEMDGNVKVARFVLER